MGRQDFPGILDRSKVVALDFGSPEFRQHAHRLVAGWARQPPFYVLGDGPPQEINSITRVVERVGLKPK
jgi:hypothetical protein